ncbi:MAG: tRNA uridine(34) 5-carboxymethylaminomethyl modification radical SAM/GNAT enzyme Elp3 [Candidatus Dojkabacteria bacterium]|nr:tRNA uridine(34) 5-carboxymethylaminomethyl modification radical SAM/GNAT enzyme Elp3 [Candidatus Dojkabacteria bacterium]
MNNDKIKNLYAELVKVFTEKQNINLEINEKIISRLQKKYSTGSKHVITKSEIIQYVQQVCNESKKKNKILHKILNALKLKPTRSISGVTTVTVLTKPFACPGQCIFCPNDIRMPKSYIATEPGAQRALANKFSPYLQVYNRLKSLKNTGHPTTKIELIILGGTWSYYPKKYKIWFIKECFRALNDFGDNVFNPNCTSEHNVEIQDILQNKDNDINKFIRTKVGNKPYNQLIQNQEYIQHFTDKYVFDDSNKFTLKELENSIKYQHEKNSTSKCRCVGLVLETRPDCINPIEVLEMRKLGATKIQLGFQTLSDKISQLNKRNETKEQVATAFRLLRAAGFKIHGHFMPNLYGSNPTIDYRVYKQIFNNPKYRPDELKIYPVSVIQNTELYEKLLKGEYKPYSKEELINLLIKCVTSTPRYCRLTRIVRDIPSTEIVAGNKLTNLRQIIEQNIATHKLLDKNIRNREIKNKEFNINQLRKKITKYKCVGSDEYFIEYVTSSDEIIGFLRLSLPHNKINPITSELNECGIIREVHVYGPVVDVENTSINEPQHIGIGTKLIEIAKKICVKNKFYRLAVISSIGTREYYAKKGFKLIENYQIIELDASNYNVSTK